MRLSFIILIVPLLSSASKHSFSRKKRQVVGQLDPDYGRNTREIILSRGFGYEFHTFVVSDGFVIGMHRIIHPFMPSTRAPVLFLHGVFENPNSFLINDPGGSVYDPPGIASPNLGFEVARTRYDVWLMEQRGLPYSSNHTKYSRFSNDYWNWSFDEIALYDLPGAIEYIREFTGWNQIGYIGYSQGTMAMFYLLSSVPKYNNIIKPFIALAPVFYQTDTIFTRSALLRHLPYDQLQEALKKAGGPFATYEVAHTLTCICRLPVIQQVCDSVLYFLLSLGSLLVIPVLPNIRPDRLAVYQSSAISLTLSNRQGAQFIQNVLQSRPSMLDMGPVENMKMFGTTIPPIYDAGKITNPYIALFSAVNDVGADPEDVQLLRESLPGRPYYDKVINDPSFGHSTFVFGNADTLIKNVVKPVLAVLSSLD